MYIFNTTSQMDKIFMDKISKDLHYFKIIFYNYLKNNLLLK